MVDVKKGVTTVVHTMKEPKVSYFKIITLIISLLTIFIVETNLLGNLGETTRTMLYIALILVSAIAGNSKSEVVKELVLKVREAARIYSDKTLTLNAKLHEIMKVLLSSSWLAGQIFEELNILQGTQPIKEEDVQ